MNHCITDCLLPSEGAVSHTHPKLILLKLTSCLQSRVRCSNCQQFGHTKVRCKEPIPLPNYNKLMLYARQSHD